MAVVIAPEDVEKFMFEAKKENLEATLVADVVDEPRLKMNWNGKTIVNLSREFLNSNGAPKYTNIVVDIPDETENEQFNDSAEEWVKLMGSLNVCSQKGLIEKFDSTIGAPEQLQLPYAPVIRK